VKWILLSGYGPWWYFVNKIIKHQIIQDREIFEKTILPY
jgi:hypothetical protein